MNGAKYYQEIWQDKDLGNQKAKEKDYDSAITHYLEAIINIEDEKENNTNQDKLNELKTLEIDCRNNLAVVKSQVNDWYFVIIHSEAVLKLDPQNKRGLQKLGQGFCEMKKFDRALEILNKAKQLYPDDKLIQEYIEKSEKGQIEEKKEGKNEQQQYQNAQSFNNGGSKYMMQ